MIKEFFNNLFAEAFKNRHFVPIVLVMLAVSLLDLIGLGGEKNIGLGFIATFFYFFFWIVYQMTRKKTYTGSGNSGSGSGSGDNITDTPSEDDKHERVEK